MHGGTIYSLLARMQLLSCSNQITKPLFTFESSQPSPSDNDPGPIEPLSNGASRCGQMRLAKRIALLSLASCCSILYYLLFGRQSVALSAASVPKHGGKDISGNLPLCAFSEMFTSLCSFASLGSDVLICRYLHLVHQSVECNVSVGGAQAWHCRRGAGGRH